jgi:hypothetical protein
MIVIGNGESRRDIDLSLIEDVKIGCNAVHRDMHVDHIVCVDTKPLKEALAANLQRTTVWTRPEYILNNKAIPLPDTLPGNQRPDQARNWGSGPYAVLIAAMLSDNIQMIGFDLYSKDKLINNIYKGTDNYSSIDSHAVDPNYWIYQISRIMQTFNDKYFIVYNKSQWQLPLQWQLDNVSFKTLDTFK